MEPKVDAWSWEIARESQVLHERVSVLLLRVSSKFGAACELQRCAFLREQHDNYVCPLGDKTQAGLVAVADHLRTYAFVMRNATPAISSLTLLRAVIENAVILRWIWSADAAFERHERAVRISQSEAISFTGGEEAASDVRYPTKRLGMALDEVARLLEVRRGNGFDSSTSQMRKVGAENLYALLSAAIHGAREVVGLVVSNTDDGGQQVTPDRNLAQLAWRDSKRVLDECIEHIPK